MQSFSLFLFLLSAGISSAQEKPEATVHGNKMKWNNCFYQCTTDTNENALLPNYELKDSIYFLNQAGEVIPNIQFPELDKEKAKEFYKIGKWNGNRKSIPTSLPVPSQYFGKVNYDSNLGHIFRIQGTVQKGNTIEKMELYMNNGDFVAFKFTLIDNEGKESWSLFGFNGFKFYVIKSSGMTSIEPGIINNPELWMNKFRTVWMECYTSNLDCE